MRMFVSELVVARCAAGRVGLGWYPTAMCRFSTRQREERESERDREPSGEHSGGWMLARGCSLGSMCVNTQRLPTKWGVRCKERQESLGESWLPGLGPRAKLFRDLSCASSNLSPTTLRIVAIKCQSIPAAGARATSRPAAAAARATTPLGAPPGSSGEANGTRLPEPKGRRTHSYALYDELDRAECRKLTCVATRSG